ncbi:uncharacterized protein LOC128381859 [Scomber japonicus]|uniref:uncharacterized protein LOC128381859 n=1 Tax=Scomber japonicus TaxID=13676 RepID=UPI002305CD6D|nr:uncharacterized protein LOC128381859 [Scomber japonicus]
MSSNMVGVALKTAFSLLLLASIVQGLRDVELFYNETVEAVVGQNVSLPCIVKNGVKIVNTEWSKRENEIIKLALYTPGFGLHRFRPNINIQTVYNYAKNFMGSYLQLYKVERENSGIYVCDITTFLFGSVRVETELKIKDAVRIMCDANNTVEVQSGENVIIHCEVSQKAYCRWTKNEKLVSRSESLELWWVTSAHAGLYTLTVDTGSETVHKKFYITVLASPKRGPRDVDLFYNETVEAVVGQNVSLPCIVRNITNLKIVNTEWSKRENEIKKLALYTPGFGLHRFRPNVSIQTVYNDAKNFMGSYLQLYKVERENSGIYVCDITTFPFGSIRVETELKIKDLADSSVTSQTSELPPTDSSVTWTTAVGSDVTRYDLRSEESSTLRSSTANSSTPGATTTLSLSAGNTTEATEYNGSLRTHWWLVFIIVLLLIIVAVCLYTRRIRRER